MQLQLVCRACYDATYIGDTVVLLPHPQSGQPILAKCDWCHTAVWTQPPLIVMEHEGKRVHGGMICPDCEKPFRDHPLCNAYPNSGIHRLCGGSFIKL